jgi:chromosome segregation ATPase
MGTREALIICASIAFIIAQGCGGSDDDKRADAPDNENAVEEYRESLRQIARDVFYQDSILSLIQSKLDSVDNEYIVFVGSIERNEEGSNQADMILDKIDRLANLIEEAKQEISGSSVSSKGLLDLISRLKTDLNRKEQKIDSLKDQITIKDSAIQSNAIQISGLKQSNIEKEQAIHSLEQEIAKIKSNAYFDLGNMLMRIADEMPDIKGIFASKSRKEVLEMQTALYYKALENYKLASFYGHPYSKSKIRDAEAKIRGQQRR